MSVTLNGTEIELITAVPQSVDVPASEYRRRIADVGRWSELHGCSASLVYSDNRLLDPWMVSQLLVQDTRELIPLVAVQPAYMHPYTVAKVVASFAQLYGRKIYLNMVAGGFGNDLKALDDSTPHDRRYDRLVEYTRIILDLVTGEAVTFEGDYYRVYDLKLSPAVPPSLRPEVFVSGSSDAGRAAADLLGARPVAYPKPPGEQEPAPAPEHRKPGLRVGIVARAESREAWRAAHERFPANRKGQLIHRMARKVSDSVWHRELSEIADRRAAAEDPYWLVPFENYATMCPYFVGSYEEVGGELARYLELGYRTFLLDIPREANDLAHARAAFQSILTEEPV
jgi:alkanesulfonate monooxygenase